MDLCNGLVVAISAARASAPPCQVLVCNAALRWLLRHLALRLVRHSAPEAVALQAQNPQSRRQLQAGGECPLQTIAVQKQRVQPLRQLPCGTDSAVERIFGLQQQK